MKGNPVYHRGVSRVMQMGARIYAPQPGTRMPNEAEIIPAAVLDMLKGIAGAKGDNGSYTDVHNMRFCIQRGTMAFQTIQMSPELGPLARVVVIQGVVHIRPHGKTDENQRGHTEVPMGSMARVQGDMRYQLRTAGPHTVYIQLQM